VLALDEHAVVLTIPEYPEAHETPVNIGFVQSADVQPVIIAVGSMS